MSPGGRWHVVHDPDDSGQRVELRNAEPTYIFAIAKRVEKVDIFEPPPQQLDYADIWENGKKPETGEPPSLARNGGVEAQRFRDRIPLPVRQIVRSGLENLGLRKSRDPFDRPYYRRISEDDLLHGRIENARTDSAREQSRT